MFTLKEKKKAVYLVVKNEISYRKVMIILGYPTSRTTLVKWVKEFQSEGCLTVKYSRTSRYTVEQKNEVVKYYFSVGQNSSKTIRKFGYPSRGILLKWIEETEPGKKNKGIAGGYMLKYDQKDKTKLVMDFALREKSVSGIAEENGIHRVSLYKWSKDLLSKEAYLIVKSNQDKNNQANKVFTDKDLLIASLKDLQIENRKLQFENDILQKATELLKKL